ncbi:MAG: MarR family winged helix-turn-helix transcriptional regulator [Mangrovibacterium sp.]
MSNYFDDCLYFRLNRILRRMTMLADSACAEYGFSSSYAYLLITININPCVGTVELADELNLSPSTITRLVDRLVRDGFVLRTKDGKRCETSCSAKGRELAEQMEITWRKFQLGMSERLGQELYVNLNHELRKLDARI